MIEPMAEQHPGSPEVTDQGSSTSAQGVPDRPDGQGEPAKQARAGLSRTTTVLALLLALAFAGAVIAGAKVLVDRNVYTDVSMGPVDSPDADSPSCTRIIDALPERTGDYRRVGVTDPAPVGTAAYRDSGGTELTVRCGVSVPAQFTTVSDLISHGGTEWLRIDDATPGSDLSTWYSLSRTPVVAVTGSVSTGSSLDRMVNLDGIGSAVAGQADGNAPTARPAPLTELKDAAGARSTSCPAFTEALPESFGDYRRRTDAPDGLVVWTAPGREPVVARCGVAMPSGYAAGVKLTQVNQVPWFEDSALASGSTAGIWYALGFSDIVAVSLPLEIGDTVLPEVSRSIVTTMDQTGN